MDDAASLRRTVRRCTAALIAALGTVAVALGPAATGLALAVALAGLCYLLGSLVYDPAWAFGDPAEEDART